MVEYLGCFFGGIMQDLQEPKIVGFKTLFRSRGYIGASPNNQFVHDQLRLFLNTGKSISGGWFNESDLRTNIHDALFFTWNDGTVLHGVVEIFTTGDLVIIRS